MEEIEFDAYCVKCKEKQYAIKGTPEQSKSGAWIVKGKCSKSGTTVVRILGKKYVQ
jgi:hypothetical protein